MAFFAILASVLVAILINARFPMRRPGLFYVGLFVSLGVAFLLPPEQLLVDPPWVRYVIAAALAFAPVFFANLVFSHSFRDTATADMAFASNLLGAMVGGALEYLALLTGYRALLPLVAVLYLLAWLFFFWCLYLLILPASFTGKEGNLFIKPKTGVREIAQQLHAEGACARNWPTMGRSTSSGCRSSCRRSAKRCRWRTTAASCTAT